jgi:hypothetical protein
MPRESSAAAERRRELARAYAEKYGSVMAPPSARRPIVPSEEIAAAVARVGEDATQAVGPDCLLNTRESVMYLGVGSTTFSKWIKRHGLPVAVGKRAPGAKCFYRVADLEAMRQRAEQARAGAPEPAPAPTPQPKPTVRTTKMPRITEQTVEAHARLDKLVHLIREGMPVHEASVEAGYAKSSTARATATRLNRTDALAVLPDGRIAENSHIADRKRQKTKKRLDKLAMLLRQGVPAEEAATQLGWTGIHPAKAIARNHGRTDVLDLIPDRRYPERRSESMGRAA